MKCVVLHSGAVSYERVLSFTLLLTDLLNKFCSMYSSEPGCEATDDNSSS